MNWTPLGMYYNMDYNTGDINKIRLNNYGKYLASSLKTFTGLTLRIMNSV